MSRKKSRQPSEVLDADVIVMGTGAAGLMCAATLAKKLRVVLLSKTGSDECSTYYAQGGIACVMSPRDSFESHIQDTLYAGDGLCEEAAVRAMVEEGPEIIRELAPGVHFDANSRGDFHLGHEGAHSHRRILHCDGDGTGRSIFKGLLQTVKRRSNVRLLEGHRVVELIVEKGRCQGAVLLQVATGKLLVLRSRFVVCASGGYSQVFQETTNPKTSTGDGLHIACRAGAVVRDPEFTQFHPTALFLAGAPRFLISEAVRGEGAILRNAAGGSFMKDIHDMAELAPRDIVSRAIVREMIKTGESCVFLDLTHLDSKKIYLRFPNIHKVCTSFGIDIARQWVPVRPAAHYTMGGILTDTDGRTTLDGLYACGEAASSGVHGANRLASNSLLEAVVYGRRVGRHINDARHPRASRGPLDIQLAVGSNRDFDVEDMIRTIQSLMWRHAGVFRHREMLSKTLKRIQHMSQLPVAYDDHPHFYLNFKSLCTTALLVLQGALLREESRGAHHRSDFPKRNDKLFKKHTLLTSAVLEAP